MTPLLCATTVLGLGAICNLFDSQNRAVSEQNILNVQTCYPDTIDQGQLGSNSQYSQGGCKLMLSYVCTPNPTSLTLGIFRLHSLCAGNLCISVIESRSSKRSHMVCCSSPMMHLWRNRCKIEHTWNSEAEALTEQSVVQHHTCLRICGDEVPTEITCIAVIHILIHWLLGIYFSWLAVLYSH